MTEDPSKYKISETLLRKTKSYSDYIQKYVNYSVPPISYFQYLYDAVEYTKAAMTLKSKSLNKTIGNSILEIYSRDIKELNKYLEGAVGRKKFYGAVGQDQIKTEINAKAMAATQSASTATAAAPTAAATTASAITAAAPTQSPAPAPAPAPTAESVYRTSVFPRGSFARRYGSEGGDPAYQPLPRPPQKPAKIEHPPRTVSNRKVYPPMMRIAEATPYEENPVEEYDEDHPEPPQRSRYEPRRHGQRRPSIEQEENNDNKNNEGKKGKGYNGRILIYK